MYNLIPYPNSLVEQNGIFVIDKNTFISSCKDALFAEKMFITMLQKSLKNFLECSTVQEGATSIAFVLDHKLKRESYTISAGEEKLLVTASCKAGFLYAVQTLRQLLELDTIRDAEELKIDCLDIEDSPKYEWRAFMLDEARNFFGSEEVYRILDLMLLHKLNVFHWHLSDDQGFRIQSKVFPLLNEIGSVRNDTQVGGWHSKKFRGIGHGGYYTQEQIRKIVDYANERNIQVVPEIDLPGHFTAILASYPHLSCTGEQIAVLSHFGVTKLIACGGKKSTYEFLEKLLGELCDLFPAPYFHIGGDEAPKEMWESCPDCQAKIAAEGLASTRELQGFMTNRIAKFLATKGKKTICWNEALCDTLDKNVIIQYWTTHDEKDAAVQLEAGRQFIISRNQSMYLDYTYAQLPLKRCYSFEPQLKEFDKMSKEAKSNIIGVEAPLWTEWVYDREKIDFNVFPRLTAFAESGWTNSENKSYKGFISRWRTFQKTLASLEVNFAKDNISTPRSIFVRRKDFALWRNSDQYSEVRKNRHEK